MSDMIYYKNGEETFRISPPTVETKCPKTKLEIKKMTEIEKTEGEIKVLQAKLELLKEMENHKSRAEEAYKDWGGKYPGTEIWTSDDDMRWVSFAAGYNASQIDYKVGAYQQERKTLYQMLYDEECRDDICYVVKEWMSQYTHNVMSEEYKSGYECCLLVLGDNLK
jgi:hypothetical protein